MTATPARVLVVTNHKGGVGKTTVAVHVAAALGEMGQRVLLVDLDPAANATSHLGMPGDLAGTFEVATGAADPFELILSHVDMGEAGLPRGVDLLPSSDALEDLSERIRARDGAFATPLECLREPFRALRAAGRWDWILCDTGPGLSLPTSAAYIVADWMLAVVRPELPSATGLVRVLRDLRAVSSIPRLNPRLRLLGVVHSQVDPRHKLARSMPATFAEMLHGEGYGGEEWTLRTELPIRQEFVNAWHARRSLFDYAPRSPVLAVVRELAREIIERAEPPPRGQHAPGPRTTGDAAAPAQAAPRPKHSAVL